LPELNAGLVSFLFGCAGGFGVTAYGLYDASLKPKADRPDFDFLYFTVALILIIMGGLCALANHLTKPISPLTAFNLGLSIPAIIKVEADRRARKPPQKQRIN
jgi:hypothetical protein